ncbi:hypothetical protein AAC387_Pa02g4396 [Persea americana]
MTGRHCQFKTNPSYNHHVAESNASTCRSRLRPPVRNHPDEIHVTAAPKNPTRVTNTKPSSGTKATCQPTPRDIRLSSRTSPSMLRPRDMHMRTSP